MSELTQISQVRCFGGWVGTYTHQSTVNNCQMRFAVYLPPKAKSDDNLPVLYWLSGLTCTEENFITKSGALKYAAKHGIVIVAPDTSPRGEGVPDDPEGSWDFGLGAGFYVNATQAPWQQHYQMYDYIRAELPALIEQNFGVDKHRKSISGHSMGGHGALVIALKNPECYRSVSAFAPIVAPTQCPWGEKAFSHYLGADKTAWLEYDACHLVAHHQGRKLPLFVSQGNADGFLAEQLKPELLVSACQQAKHPLQLERHPEYDHSYFFIASFIEQHMLYHANALNED